LATTDNSPRPDAGINALAGQQIGSRRRLGDRLFAIGWAASVVGATFGWLYFLQRVISYSMNLLD